MILLKGIGVKATVGLLAVIVGIAGVATGAKWHAARSLPGQHRIVVGRIVALHSASLTMVTIGGKHITGTLTATTEVHFAGRRVLLTDLRRGDLITIVANTMNKGYIIQAIRILKPSNISPRAP